MQTDCPTEDMKDRKMKRKNNGRMRRTMVSRKTRLCKKSYLTQGTQNLPHLKAREKKIRREEVRTQHKRVKRKQRCEEKQEDSCVRGRAEEAAGCSAHARTLTAGIGAAHHFMLLLHLAHFLGVVLVHLLQFSHHTLTAFAQSLFIVDELRGHARHKSESSDNPEHRSGSDQSLRFPT